MEAGLRDAQEGRVIATEQMKAEIAYFFQMIKTANPDAAVKLDNKLQAAAEGLLVFPMKWDNLNLT